MSLRLRLLEELIIWMPAELGTSFATLDAFFPAFFRRLDEAEAAEAARLPTAAGLRRGERAGAVGDGMGVAGPIPHCSQ